MIIYIYFFVLIILLCPACQKVDAKSAHASLCNSNGGYFFIDGLRKTGDAPKHKPRLLLMLLLYSKTYQIATCVDA